MINLFASDEFVNVLKQIEFACHVTEQVLAETLYVRSVGRGGEAEMRRLMLDPHVDAGLVSVCTPSQPDELDLYVKIAADLDDGEAASIAIAALRKMTFATDDRKARRIAEDTGVAVITTPELMKNWADKAQPNSARVAVALRNIEENARFAPARDAPCQDWWRDMSRR